MKQRKTRQKNLTPDQVFAKYDSVTLLALIRSFEASEGWDVFKAYASIIQRQYEVDALDRAGKKDESVPVAFASGYAKCAEDMTKNFMEGLKQTVLNVSPVIKNDRIEEVEPKTVHDLQ